MVMTRISLRMAMRASEEANAWRLYVMLKRAEYGRERRCRRIVLEAGCGDWERAWYGANVCASRSRRLKFKEMILPAAV